MNKFFRLLGISMALLLALSSIAFANMSAPLLSDIGSSITFEKNQDISVLSEHLTIQVKNETALIVAKYTMKNTQNHPIATPVMFLSPNIQNSDVSVMAGNKQILFEVKSYHLNYDTQVEKKGWEYAVLTDESLSNPNDPQRVDSLYFKLSFAPKEEVEVLVSYRYNLGGYPHLNFDAKYGKIDYFLAPAALWKDFGDLTIRLTLDESMPVLKKSNLDFQKMGPRTYEYHSHSLPGENLKIVIDENWYQNIFSTLRNPYLIGMFLYFSPYLLGIIGVIAGIRFWFKRKNWSM